MPAPGRAACAPPAFCPPAALPALAAVCTSARRLPRSVGTLGSGVDPGVPWPGGVVRWHFTNPNLCSWDMDPGPAEEAGRLEITNSHRQLVLEAISKIEAVSCITFVEDNHPDCAGGVWATGAKPNVAIFGYSERSDGDPMGNTEPGKLECPGSDRCTTAATMGADWTSRLQIRCGCADMASDRKPVFVSAMVHELMHTLGFHHTHQRPDRDLYIDVVLNCVKSGVVHQFDKEHTYNWTRRGNDFSDPHSCARFDFHSIMLYGSQSFSSNPGGTCPTMLKKDGSQFAGNVDLGAGLSPLDIWQLNSRYRCPEAAQKAADAGCKPYPSSSPPPGTPSPQAAPTQPPASKAPPPVHVPALAPAPTTRSAAPTRPPAATPAAARHHGRHGDTDSSVSQFTIIIITAVTFTIILTVTNIVGNAMVKSQQNKAASPPDSRTELREQPLEQILDSTPLSMSPLSASRAALPYELYDSSGSEPEEHPISYNLFSCDHTWTAPQYRATDVLTCLPTVTV